MATYPGARFEPTELALDQMSEQGLEGQYVVDAIQDYGARREGIKPNQFWYRGPRNRHPTIEVLIEERGPTLVKIITVHLT